MADGFHHHALMPFPFGRALQVHVTGPKNRPSPQDLMRVGALRPARVQGGARRLWKARLEESCTDHH